MNPSRHSFFLHRPINIDDLLTEIFIMRFRIFIPVIFSERDVRQYLQEVDKVQHQATHASVTPFAKKECDCWMWCDKKSFHAYWLL